MKKNINNNSKTKYTGSKLIYPIIILTFIVVIVLSIGVGMAIGNNNSNTLDNNAIIDDKNNEESNWKDKNVIWNHDPIDVEISPGFIELDGNEILNFNLNGTFVKNVLSIVTEFGFVYNGTDINSILERDVYNDVMYTKTSLVVEHFELRTNSLTYPEMSTTHLIVDNLVVEVSQYSVNGSTTIETIIDGENFDCFYEDIESNELISIKADEINFQYLFAYNNNSYGTYSETIITNIKNLEGQYLNWDSEFYKVKLDELFYINIYNLDNNVMFIPYLSELFNNSLSIFESGYFDYDDHWIEFASKTFIEDFIYFLT